MQMDAVRVESGADHEGDDLFHCAVLVISMVRVSALYVAGLVSFKTESALTAYCTVHVGERWILHAAL